LNFNVEIYLDLNFFWQIVDVEKMVLKTDDPPEDICHHAQSQILSDISRTDMKEFMESFNEIVQSSISKDYVFYSERGVKLPRVEITGRTYIKCFLYIFYIFIILRHCFIF
jgi:hypothetical protein